jgi:hypothetical protein
MTVGLQGTASSQVLVSGSRTTTDMASMSPSEVGNSSQESVEPTGGAVQPPVPRHSHRRVWLTLGVIIVAIGVVVAAIVVPITEGSVTASWVKWFGMNTCGGLSGTTTGGFHGPKGGSVHYTVPNIENPNTTSSCTIHSVESAVPGFGVTAGNFPLTIPAAGNETLNLTISLPQVAFEGNLTLIIL